MIKTIHSRDNPLFKQLVKLASSARERKKSGLTVLDGAHLVEAYCASQRQPRRVIVAASAMDLPETQAILAKVVCAEVVCFDDALMVEISALESPAALMALIDTPANAPLPAHATSCVVLEAIQDPGNVGSILRSAAAADVRRVVLSPGCAFAWSPKVLRAAQGAHFALDISEGVEVVEFVQRVFATEGQVLALAPKAESSLYDYDLTQATAFLVGNEGAGLSSALMQVAHHRISIPMPGAMESLNVAASAAVCLFERVRQLTHR